MAPFAARAIIGLIFGFLIYETINEFNKLFGLSLTPYLAFAIVPAVVVYIFKEFVIKKLRAYEKAIATTIMRMIGSVRSLSHAPDSVMRPLIMPPQDGIQSMIENTMPSVCAQSGSAV